MSKNRLESFSDGVLAIVITIMVLKINPPKTMDLNGILELAPTFSAYILSFIYVGIYWMNHHHLISTVDHVTGKLLFKNLHWIFWITLIPMGTEWIRTYPFEKIPTIFYSIILFMSAVSYIILQQEVVRISGKKPELTRSLGKDIKGKISVIISGLTILISAYYPILVYIIYSIVFFMWSLPDKRIEKMYKSL